MIATLRSIPWSKARQQKAEAARNVLRMLVRDHEDATLVISPSVQGAVLVDLAARADVGLAIILLAPDPRSIEPAKESLERRYNRTIAHIEAMDGQRADVIRVSATGEIDVLGDWSDDDVLAYAQAHKTPSFRATQARTETNHLRVVDRALVAAGC